MTDASATQTGDAAPGCIDREVGWRMRVDGRARRTQRGRVLIGGSPLRILKLSNRGRQWLDDGEADRPVPTDQASVDLMRRLVDGGLAHPIPPRGHGPTPSEVVLVVPVKDDAGGLRRTLAEGDEVGGVVVVDDGSAKPRDVARIADSATNTRYHPRSLGPAAARNTGWRSTSEPFIAFVDAGVDLHNGWLQPLLDHFEDRSVGAVAPRVVSRSDMAPRWLATYEAVCSRLDLGSAPSAVRPGAAVSYVPTAALVVRREALEAVGGFDASLRVGEDVDLVWRLHNAGWRLRYEPAVVVSHPTRPTFAAWLKQRFTYGTSAAALTKRHGPNAAPLQGVSTWSVVAWGAVASGHLIAGLGVASASTAVLARRMHGLEHPVVEAGRVASVGNLWAGRAIANTLVGPWWPLTLILGLLHRRSRPAIVAAGVIPPLVEWRSRRPGLDPVRYCALSLADQMAYGTGVWIGCIRLRSGRALVPSLHPTNITIHPDGT